MKIEGEKLDDNYVLWTKEQVKSLLGFKSNGALYNAIKVNGFPKPLKIGGQASRWRKSDVLAYIDRCDQKLANED